MNNSIIFHEIISQSPVERQPFYAQVFGWQFTMVSDPQHNRIGLINTSG